MKSIKGPAIFLAQFAGDEAPFNSFPSICRWAADLGYKGVQIPGWDARLIDLKKAAESKTYCDELKGSPPRTASRSPSSQPICRVSSSRCIRPMTRRSTPLRRRKSAAIRKRGSNGRSNRSFTPRARAATSGSSAHVTFSGALAWPYLYPWPPRPADLVRAAFEELGRRWRPILDAHEECGVDVCFELHPGEDLFDGTTYERFLDVVGGHKRCCLNYDPSHFVLQQLDYVGFIDVYHERIKAFHVKDAELRSSPKQGVYSGFADWPNRAGRFRSLGDGDVDFGAIFSSLSVYGYDSWAVLEWECAIKNRNDGAREGAPFIAKHLIKVTETTFDDFIDQSADRSAVNRALGLSR